MILIPAQQMIFKFQIFEMYKKKNLFKSDIHRKQKACLNFLQMLMS